RPRSCPDRAKAPVPSVALPTLVAIAVPLIAAGGRPESRNSPIVTSTPPGPSAVVPTPPAKPNSARRISVPAARWSALCVSPTAASGITLWTQPVARAPLASGDLVRQTPAPPPARTPLCKLGLLSNHQMTHVDMGPAIRHYQPEDLDAVVELSLRAWAPVFASLQRV